MQTNIELLVGVVNRLKQLDKLDEQEVLALGMDLEHAAAENVVCLAGLSMTRRRQETSEYIRTSEGVILI